MTKKLDKILRKIEKLEVIHEVNLDQIEDLHAENNLLEEKLHKLYKKELKLTEQQQ